MGFRDDVMMMGHHFLLLSCCFVITESIIIIHLCDNDSVYNGSAMLLILITSIASCKCQIINETTNIIPILIAINT